MLENTVYKTSATLIAGQVQVDFTDFAIYDETHLAVYVDEVLQTSGYTVTLTDAALPSRGNVVFDTAPGAGKVVVLKPEPPLTQTLNFINNESTPALLQNRSLDLIVQTLQNFSEQLGRCAKSGINTDEPGDAIDWTAIIGAGSITASMLNADVTTMVNALIVAGTLDTSDVNALIVAGITGKANVGANSDITSLTGCGAISPASGDITLSPAAGHIVADTASGANLAVYNSGSVSISLANGGAYAIEVTHVGATAANFFVFHDADSVVGTISFTGNTTYYNTTSDERLKSNVKDFTALEIVREMKPKKYDRVKGAQKEYGFLAQQLYKVLPEAVTVGGTNVKKNPWMVDLTKLIPISIQGIIELDKENDRLRKRIKAVEDKVGI